MTGTADIQGILDRRLSELVESGIEIGAQVCVYKDGKQIADCSAGLADRDTGRRVDGDTLFNVFSVSKAVAATAVHIQADRGLIEYDAPIARYWPEFGANGKEKATIRHALTHRSGVPQMPEGVTPEQMCDWDWMTGQIAAARPIAEPGTKALYQAMTFGWLVGEVVRRTDPKGRPFNQFIREEIALPLGAPDLWFGVPDSELGRVAPMYDYRPTSDPATRPALSLAAMPPQVDLVPAVFERPDVRAAVVAAVGGVFSARSEARFWAMLAGGGQLDGVRLLSEPLARSLNTPRPHSEEPDVVMYGIPLPLSIGGYWLGANRPAVWAVGSPTSICHPGAGGSLGWADQENDVAVAICHNRLVQGLPKEEDGTYLIGSAINQALGLAAY